MNRAVHKLSLAIGFGIGVIVAITGAAAGLNAGELALVCAITIVGLYLVVRAIGGYYGGVITRQLAQNRSEQATRRLLDPRPASRAKPPA